MAEITDFNQDESLNPVPKKGIGKKKNKLILIISACVAVAALAVGAVLVFGSPAKDAMERVTELGTALHGVTVGGIDISGMTKEEALAATANLPDQLLGQISFYVDIEGEIKTYSAQDFALSTDYDKVIEQAVAYGRTGSFDERLDAAKAADTGVDFPVDVVADEVELKAALALLKSGMDHPAVNAQADFAPWGYTVSTDANGQTVYTKYSPELSEIIAMCKAHAKAKEYSGEPKDLVRISEADKPNPLRYEYYKNTKFVKNHIPPNADIARFIYTDSVDGFEVDIDAIADAVISQVKNDAYETIVASTTPVTAEVTLEDVKNQTQLIASWTSSYSAHSGYNRNYNVAMMSSVINDTVIKPGETFSVNDTAGPRDAKTAKTYGWRKAAGLYNGGTTQQYGGGVCQLGSTTYNACIRSGVKIVSFWHHTIPSAYIPYGLDATLDTPSEKNPAGKDLVLGNDTQNTFYIVSYVSPKDKTVTVEVYGVPLTDASGQPILLTYKSKRTGRYGGGSMNTITVSPGGTAPNGHVVHAGESYVFSKPRSGTTVDVYQITMTLDGTQISKVQYGETVKYPPFDGYTYTAPGPAPLTP